MNWKITNILQSEIEDMADPIPPGFSSVTPHIVVKRCSDAIDFYKTALNAKEIYRSLTPDGKVMHAMIQIGNSIIMLADEFPDIGSVGPSTLGGTPFVLHIYTDNADKLYKRAIDSGAISIMPVADMFWGDRYGQIQDPFGHRWAIATHTKDISPKEMEDAAKKFFDKGTCLTK